MAKVVVYTLLATAFVILIAFSPSKQHSHNHGSRGRNRRLGYKFSVTNFDPLVAELERLAENHGLGDPINPLNLENNSFPDEVADAYEYFSEGKLNITLRLIVLFPWLDKAPNDGVVSFKELEAWIAQQTLQGLNFRTQKELALRDRDEDGAISFREYLSQFSNEDLGTCFNIFGKISLILSILYHFCNYILKF